MPPRIALKQGQNHRAAAPRGLDPEKIGPARGKNDPRRSIDRGDMLLDEQGG